MVIDETVEADDVDAAEDLIGRVYDRARFRESATPFSFRQRVVGDERVTFARFQISSTAELAVDFGDVLGVGSLTAGDYRAASNGDPVEVGAPFLLRPGLAQSWSSGMDLTMVNLDLPAFRRYIAGEDRATVRVAFPTVGPASVAHAAAWARTSRTVGQTMADPMLRGNEMMRASAVDLLFAAAAVCFPVEVTAAVGAASEAPMPKAVRRAVALIDSDAHRPLRMQDLAEAAGVTERGLHAAFRRSLGTTPGAYLRRVRLAEVRRELLHAADDVTVSDVANRWGFTNRGRMAVEYRAVYGESPRDTLDR